MREREDTEVGGNIACGSVLLFWIKAASGVTDRGIGGKPNIAAALIPANMLRYTFSEESVKLR